MTILSCFSQFSKDGNHHFSKNSRWLRVLRRNRHRIGSSWCRQWQIDWPICGTGRQRSQWLAIHQKKRWKSAILWVGLGFWRCCNSVFFGSSPPSQAIESGDFEVVFTISGTLPSGIQQAACFGIRISWKMERFCGDIWWEYSIYDGILYGRLREI